MQPHENDVLLAKIMLNHSLSIKPKDKILINLADATPFGLVKALYIEALKLGAYPIIDQNGVFFQLNRSNWGGLRYQFYKHANDWQLNYIEEEILQAKVDWADAFINLAANDNVAEYANIDIEKLSLRQKLVTPIFNKLINKNRWVLTYYPTPAMAQNAGMALDELVDFYYKSCLVDYDDMAKKLKNIEKAIDAGDEVTIVGEQTNLKFSIKGLLGQAATGECNIPDGEVFSSVVKGTANGTIYFDIPTNYMGSIIRGIHLEFKDGKIVKASAEQGEEKLLKILDTDDGAKGIGELGIGANFGVTKPMLNTLFDEKMGGTIHLALGRSYEEKRGGDPVNGNKSAIHWDIVKDMRLKGSKLSIDGNDILVEGEFKV